MGTINYYTSDYVTLGYDLSYDFSEDFETYEEAQEELFFDIECMHDNINYLLKKYDFYYYHVVVKPGYYEGFSIDIENNFPLCYNDYFEKREAQKEITLIKKFLFECLDYGLCVVHPGWCTSYLDRNASIKAVKEAVLYMRDEAKNILTWSQYEREEKVC